jgi:GT2 family glycosyltransferase
MLIAALHHAGHFVLGALGEAALLAFCTWCFATVTVSIACWFNGRWLRPDAFRPKPRGRATPRGFLFIVPTLGERTLENTLDALDALETPRECHVEVIVVGPPAQGGGPGPSHAAVQALRTRNGGGSPLSAMTDSGPKGGKPERLNFVIRSLGKKKLADFDYVVMVDSDTQVPSDLVARMVETAASDSPAGWPEALQPLVVSAPGDTSNPRARAEAAMHTRWRAGYEFSLLRLGHRPGERQRRHWVPFSYAVGCCLAVRVERAWDEFPTPCEDLTLGYNLSREGLAVAPVPTIATTHDKGKVRDIAERHLTWYEFSRDALRPDRPSAVRRCLRARGLLAIERGRLWSWVPGSLMFVVVLGLAVWDEPARAVSYASVAVGSAAVAFLLGGIAVALSGPHLRPGWSDSRPSTIAWCMVRWSWTSFLPLVMLLTRLGHREEVAWWLAAAACPASPQPLGLMATTVRASPQKK